MRLAIGSLMLLAILATGWRGCAIVTCASTCDGSFDTGWTSCRCAP